MPTHALSNLPNQLTLPIRNKIYDGIDVNLTTQNSPSNPNGLFLSLNMRYNNRLASSVDARTTFCTLIPSSDALFATGNDTIIIVTPGTPCE